MINREIVIEAAKKLPNPNEYKNDRIIVPIFNKQVFDFSLNVEDAFKPQHTENDFIEIIFEKRRWEDDFTYVWVNEEYKIITKGKLN